MLIKNRHVFLDIAFPFLLLVTMVGTSRAQGQLDQINRGNDLLRGQKPADALLQFQQALASQPENKDALWGAARAHEALGHWPEAIESFRHLAVIDPKDVEAWFGLGRIYSWTNRYEESYQAFEKAVKLAPERTDISNGYAEVLSYNPKHRKEAIARYQGNLAEHPDNVQSKIGLAQAQAWSGSISVAKAGYQSLLATDPRNVAALLGLSEIARWKMRMLEADRLLRQAIEIAPKDSRITAAEVETNFGMARYDSARAGIKLLATINPELAQRLDRKLDQERSPSLDFGFSLRRDQKVEAPSRLNYEAYSVAIQIPTPIEGHITIFSDTPLYRGESSIRTANYSGLRWDIRPTYRIRLTMEAVAEMSGDRSNSASGSFDTQFITSDAYQMNLSIERRLVVDSLQAVRGSAVDGRFLGQVHSNLASWHNSLRLSSADVDLYANLTGGFYQGHGLDRNWMGQIDTGVGKLVHTSKPGIRIGYGLTTIRFVQDQSFLPGDVAPTNRMGGYFSPRLFLNNFGILGLSGTFSIIGEWEVGGTLGAQQVRDRYTDFDAVKLSSTVHSSILIPLHRTVQVRASYDFLNVGSSFRRNILGCGLHFIL